MASLIRSSVEKSSSDSSRCNPSRRAAYQSQRRKVALALPSSAGEASGIFVRYSIVPAGTADGVRSASHCGSSEATCLSTAQTLSGGSSTANMLVTVSECRPAGRLRFANEAAANTEFGVI